MIKIGFIKHSSSSFITKDIELLQKEFDVSICETSISIKNPLRSLRDILRIIKTVYTNDVSYTWFASHHALVMTISSKILRKKSIVVIGGYEVERLEDIGYGAMISPIRSITPKIVMKTADKLISVSNYSRSKILQYINEDKVQMIYNCVESSNNQNTKENLVVTIGNATKASYKLKGLDLYAKISAHHKDIRFIIIGNYDLQTKHKLRCISPNLIFTGHIDHNEVQSFLRYAKVYCQFSKVESFGMGLVESMTHECIPVILDNGAMKEVTNRFSIITTEQKATTDFKKALLNNKDLNIKEYTDNKFSCKKRSDKLIKIIKEM